MSLQPLEAVLFDMDGTLVETEHHWGEAMQQLAARLGGRMSDAARARTVGTSMRFSMTVLHDDLGLVRTEEQLDEDAQWVEDRTAALMATEGIDWRPGARELLTAVRGAGLATALVTTTPRRIAGQVLDRIAGELGGSPFDVTVCGDEAGPRKPDPAPYRKAMADLGVDPAGCVVIEDSSAGVTAGLAAGAVVVGVPSLQPLDRRPGLTLRDTLTGLSVDALAALLADPAAV